jgi:hypothetical protein
MTPVIRSVTAAFVVLAMAAPSVGAPLSSHRDRETKIADLESATDRHEAQIDRQQKDWTKLSATICAGCITAANRVAPLNIERPGFHTASVAAQPLTAAKAEQVKTGIRTITTPKRFAQLNKRYARLHKRERQRLALRARQQHAAALLKRRQLRAAALRRHMQRPVTAKLAPSLVPAYVLDSAMPVYRIPVDRPAIPAEDGRWRETILPTGNSGRLRRT